VRKVSVQLWSDAIRQGSHIKRTAFILWAGWSGGLWLVCQFGVEIGTASAGDAGLLDSSAEDAVADSSAKAVRVERGIGVPALVFKINGPHCDLACEPIFGPAAKDEVGCPAVEPVSCSAAPAEQEFAIRSPAAKFPDGNLGANQVVVLADATEFVEAEPARFAFDLQPSGKMDVGKSANADQPVGARTRGSTTA
jgi:hypothetical protein